MSSIFVASVVSCIAVLTVAMSQMEKGTRIFVVKFVLKRKNKIYFLEVKQQDWVESSVIKGWKGNPL